MSFINDLYSLISNNIVLLMLIGSFMGFFILLVHGIFFRYLLYKNFIFVSLILPVMVLLVTKVIATNLYLSLGMIGALSIVRFRNPVKSPFELTMFFTLITIGIAMGVNYKWGILLTLVIVIVIILSKILENISSNMGKKLFTISFDEGNEKIFLEINSKSKFKELDESKFLAQVSKIDENNFFYRMVFDNKNEIDNFIKKFSLDDKTISYEIRYL